MAKADSADIYGATRARLHEIDNELAQLQEKRSELKAQWQLEKELIGSIRSMKSQIEEFRTEAATYERQGDLGKVAEIRYGKITALERQIAETNTKLEAAQRGKRMLKEEVDEEDIAQVVS
ncbi:MAG: type VI secretion system ATPase TssH, partial [Bacteroidota bacterium]